MAMLFGQNKSVEAIVEQSIQLFLTTGFLSHCSVEKLSLDLLLFPVMFDFLPNQPKPTSFLGTMPHLLTPRLAIDCHYVLQSSNS